MSTKGEKPEWQKKVDRENAILLGLMAVEGVAIVAIIIYEMAIRVP